MSVWRVHSAIVKFNKRQAEQKIMVSIHDMMMRVRYTLEDSTKVMRASACQVRKHFLVLVSNFSIPERQVCSYPVGMIILKVSSKLTGNPVSSNGRRVITSECTCVKDPVSYIRPGLRDVDIVDFCVSRQTIFYSFRAMHQVSEFSHARE